MTAGAKSRILLVCGIVLVLVTCPPPFRGLVAASHAGSGGRPAKSPGRDLWEFRQPHRSRTHHGAAGGSHHRMPPNQLPVKSRISGDFDRIAAFDGDVNDHHHLFDELVAVPPEQAPADPEKPFG